MKSTAASQSTLTQNELAQSRALTHCQSTKSGSSVSQPVSIFVYEDRSREN